MVVWRDVFLGVIAVATLAIAITQIAVIVAAGRAAKRLSEIAEEFQREVKPLVANLNAVQDDVSLTPTLRKPHRATCHPMCAQFLHGSERYRAPAPTRPYPLRDRQQTHCAGQDK